MRMFWIGLLLATTAAIAEPLPQPKAGQCPAGYHESGGYCGTNVVAFAGRHPKAWPMPLELGAEWRLLRSDATALTARLR
jgi:hypothetical protein